MYDLTRFTLRDATACGAALRRMGDDAPSMEDAAARVVRYLHERLRVPASASDPDATACGCALVRLFTTLDYEQLEPELQGFASRVLGREPDRPGLKCLTLLATAGERPAWNARRESAAHQALPLVSEASVARSPMIAQLVTQLGVGIGRLVTADRRLLLDEAQHTYNVFYVGDAVGSPYIPAQAEFVVPHGVQSVIGFGGLLPSGDLFATILFAKRHVPRETAELFRTLALSVKLSLLPFVGGRVFA